MSNDVIAKSLGLPPLEEVVDKEENVNFPAVIKENEKNIIIPPENEATKEVLDDIEFARENIKDLIEKGADSLDELINIAKQGQLPRSFEVVSTMIKTLIDANKDLVDMTTKKKYEKEDAPATQTNITNNNLVLSTNELLKMLKGD